MQPKPKEQRVEVLIDVQNLYYSAKNLYHSKVNFQEVLKQAVAGRKFIRAFGYVVRTKTGEEAPFFDALSKIGIETRVRDLQEWYGGAKKADWDVGLAVDAIKMSHKVDTVIIASGDGDFIPLVEYLQMNGGTQVEVVAFGKSSSMKLKEACDDFLDLSENPNKYLMRGGNRR